MNGTFVPLSTQRPAEEFLAVPTPTSAKVGEVAADRASAPGHGTACVPAVKREPVLELIRDGSRVSHLKITCACGEIITVECQF